MAPRKRARPCVPGVKSQRGAVFTDGIGGSDWCELYASTDVVKGRWTPTTIGAYEAFLKSRDPRARGRCEHAGAPFARRPDANLAILATSTVYRADLP